MAILELLPGYVWWLLAFVLAFVIYKFAFDDDMQEQTRGFVKTYAVWLILVLVFLYGRNNWGYWEASEGLIHFSRVSDTFLIVISLTILLGRMFLGRERYLSTQAIADNRSGSCAEYQEVGDYVVMNIGSCDADMFPWLTGHETWIVPKRHFSKINGADNKTRGQIIIETFITKKDITEINTACQSFIEGSKGYHKEDIYHGEFSRNEILQNPGRALKDKNGKKLTLSDYEKKLDDTTRLLNEARAMIQGKTKTMLGYVSHVGQIMKKAKGTEPTPQYAPPQEPR